ncbi:DUF2783 domain-containing protein [Thiolinea disciformis]|uniref:DUF2783 domain-containing protein n=1 Tax=Thiolinea disciformis TaxID=125614 RepID=UPI0003706870|nr:DUF2783 domain-containing protein [Thiolinea disciformis]
MSALNLNSNFTNADAFYAALADLHRDGDEEKSQRINARLILLLANHIGDQTVLMEAMHIAADLPQEGVS